MIQVWIDDRKDCLVLPWHEVNAHIVRSIARDGVNVVVAKRNDPRIDMSMAFELANGPGGWGLLWADGDIEDELNRDVSAALDYLKPGEYPIYRVTVTTVDRFEVAAYEEAGI